MSVELIWYPKCSTCRNAKKALESAGEDVILRHIAEEPLSESELKELILASGLPVRKWFNTSGNKYKELGLKDKLSSMNEEEMIRLLASDGMLVKRPVLKKGDQVSLGYRP